MSSLYEYALACGRSWRATTEKSSDFGLEILGEAWLLDELEEQSTLSLPLVKITGDF